ncbi:MAG: hypothetical protein COV76_06375 [Candidatus Omnitrophica bacterium CG11_big_fil_rev_8_21_14_0_20_64_10]|nr:MAG: hypothetical protein COV76_06375 [Candidatus Omnitrophica bacterium CG11_big_fil_rev_8_21_14_0_20_64_10]
MLNNEGSPQTVSTPLEKLQQELTLSGEVIAAAERWIPTLRKRLAEETAGRDALPGVCSFFALWSLHLFKGSHQLIDSRLYSGSLLLLRPLIEAHIELSFILHRDCGKRAAEYLNSSREKRPPYRDQAAFSGCDTIGKRAGRCGLGELYRKTYLSLSYYSHLRIRGALAFDPDSEQNVREAAACLVVGEAMLAKIAKQLSRAFNFRLPDELAQAFAGSLRRYKGLIRYQEEQLSRKRQPEPASLRE